MQSIKTLPKWAARRYLVTETDACHSSSKTGNYWIKACLDQVEPQEKLSLGEQRRTLAKYLLRTRCSRNVLENPIRQKWLFFPFYRWETWCSRKFKRPARSQSVHKWCSEYWHFCFKNTVYGFQIYVITHTGAHKLLIKGLRGLKRFKITVSVVPVLFQKHLNKICSYNCMKTSPEIYFHESVFSLLCF